MEWKIMVWKLAAISAAWFIAAAGLSGCSLKAACCGRNYQKILWSFLWLMGFSELIPYILPWRNLQNGRKNCTDGRIQVQIFPNGQLGSENENGAADGRRYFYDKVSAPDQQPTMKRIMPLGCRISLTVPMIFTTNGFSVPRDFFLSQRMTAVALTYYTPPAHVLSIQRIRQSTPEDLKPENPCTGDEIPKYDMLKALGVFLWRCPMEMWHLSSNQYYWRNRK